MISVPTTSLPKCYIAGALTNIDASDCLLKMYERIAEECEDFGFDVYLPHIAKRQAVLMSKELTPEVIFQWDSLRLSESNVIIAFVGFPSLGVGIELGIAACLHIPIITLCKKGLSISPMVLGHPGLHRHIYYENEDECLEILKKSLDTLHSCDQINLEDWH